MEQILGFFPKGLKKVQKSANLDTGMQYIADYARKILYKLKKVKNEQKRLKTAKKSILTSFCVRAAPKSWSKYTTNESIFGVQNLGGWGGLKIS